MKPEEDANGEVKNDAVLAARFEKMILVEESADPPVTKITLSELDIPRIVYNPKLRHDVNFDPDLHFRPNLDCESGHMKAQKANYFWYQLRSQVEYFLANPLTFERELGKEWCLPLTLQAIGEILGTLVPPEDRSAVEEILNVKFLMQQFRKGVTDLEKLGIWLGRTLKSHCAPMRDEWVDEMIDQLTFGGRDGDIGSIIQGLRSLLGVLEAMKLDVANHQIRCLRPLLIQDTVEFEHTFFIKKIALLKIDITGAYAWFQAAKSLSIHNQPQTSFLQGDMWTFFKGFTDLLLPSKIVTRVPDTFMFDEERINKLRSEISGAINLDVCFRLLENIHNKEAQITTISALRSPLSGTQPKLDKSPRVINLESDNDEFYLFGEHPSHLRVHHLSRSTELVAADSKLRQAILAIVNNSSGNNKWQQSSSNIATELIRSTRSHKDFSRLESQLTLHLCNPTSSVFQRSESHILTELYPLLSDLAVRYALLTATQLFEVATARLPYQAQIPQHTLGDIAKKMAHIGILHWRVWAQLAYLVDPDDLKA